MLLVIGFFIVTFTGSVYGVSEAQKCKDEESCLKNEYYTKSNPICIRTCANRTDPVRINCELFTGCACDEGYVRKYDDGTGPCIRETKCATNRICPKYERYTRKSVGCPKTCGNRRVSASAVTCPPKKGCICDAGYVRKFDNATGSCIRASECPKIPTNCGVNEIPTSCDIKCSTQTCDSLFSRYDCPKTECEPGCICRDNYLRNSDNVCIFFAECFSSQPLICGPNEVASQCAMTCPPQSCDSIYTEYMCAKKGCTPGCDCIDGYLRNSEGECIPSDQCFNEGAGCRGDANATQVACGSACEATCAQPDTDRPCILLCKVNACKCNSGYILTESGGVCIKPEDCPGGNPTCGANKTYVNCNVGCPTNYCPRDDGRAIVACDPPFPCPGGCACESGYLMLSDEDKRCVLSSECPPVNCTRPNEVWDANPTKCFDERCGSKCDNKGQSAPRCVCKDGFFRNENDICVPESECPIQTCNGDPNASFSTCLSACPKTCTNKDKVLICPAVCRGSGCKCNPGYVLNDDGLCVKPEECPASEGCNGDPNAELSDCITACPRTCENQEDDPFCPISCDAVGCVCKPEFVLNTNGSCIKPEECIGPRGCNGDPNAQFSECPSACPVSCNNKEIVNSCASSCESAGCECKPGFVLNDNGKCVKPKDCPGGSPKCPANQTYVDCTACATDYCTSLELRGQFACSVAYPCPGGCVCSNGYAALSYEDPRCVLTSDCPSTAKCPKPNEVWEENPSACYSEKCENRDGACDDIIKKIIVFPRCVCVEGYYRNKDGDCVPESECPPIGCNGDPNAMFSGCLTGCPRTCEDQEDDELCPVSCDTGGCVCKPGFVLNTNGSCIKPEQCTGPRGCNGDPNAKYSDCPSPCPVSCDNKEQSTTCSGCGPAGCECKPNHVLNENGRCVKPNDCPGGSPICPANQTYVYCTVCASNYCPISDNVGRGACGIAYPCPGGCACSSGYLQLNYEDKRCISSSDCPPVTCTRPNEIWDPKPSRCYLESCRDIRKECDFVGADEPRCVCKEGYYRNDENVCVPESECPPISCLGDLNATFSLCLSGCPKTCTNKDDDIFCTADCKGSGCTCKPGYVLNNDGLCIKPQDCPADLKCNGDRNATFQSCPSSCQASCDAPDQSGACSEVCAPEGCACKPGYVLSQQDGGQCIQPTDCPDGIPKCPENELYEFCKTNCSTDFCPQNDSLSATSCNYVFPCRGGCVCREGFLRLSNEDPRCVALAECPPVECTRPNEVWDPNPPVCLRERCEEMNTECNFPILQSSKCVCIPGYFRNENDICVPAPECPTNGCKGDPNASFRDCLSDCPLTCANKDLDIACIEVCRPAGCVCNPGYVLSDIDGICIRIEDCPAESQCNGDRNATFQTCPSYCRETCDNPEGKGICPQACAPDGCICKLGFVLTQEIDGKCIDPSDCPGGSPTCPVNEEYVNCKVSCPSNYCPTVFDDSSSLVICDPIFPCKGGCVCKEGYLRYNQTDDRCVPVTECPQIECTKPNEVWEPNPPKCLRERCDSRNIECDFPIQQPPRCICKPGYYRNQNDICVPASECPASQLECGLNEVAVPCRTICPPQNCEIAYTDYACTEETKICEPGCDCLPNHLRNGSGICVPNNDCPLCSVSTECRRTCSSPNPPNCPYSPPEENINGCDCKMGYVLSEIGGECIKIEDCPSELGCNGDPNARPKQCPLPCPSTCESPDAVPCKMMCDPIGCECKPGFILSNATGECVLPNQCPGGNPCGSTGLFAFCKNECPQDYCPVDDSRDIIACDPSPECLSGCICDLNHKRKSLTDPTCVVSSDCPPVPCTRPNEEWSGCPSDCLQERCEDIHNQPTACNTLVLNCQPKCICKKDHFRNATDICVPVKDCPC
ncbi:zonadhesin-like [Trichoplusia ni]|uniref:Zonadhesin-like n=1 Tax=Trichoplusia ni TaxID=7111 RepID=A0A7E5VU88_TRINI|nr:zonadhesin-like [Trichoplusia ni]